MSKTLSRFGITLVLAAASFAAADGTIVAPNFSNGPAAEFGTALANIHNRSGVNIPFQPNLTDFDQYLAANPTHNNGSVATVYLTSSANAGDPWTLSFNRGIAINGFAIANKDDSFGVEGFAITNGGSVVALSTLNFVSAASQPAVPFERFNLGRSIVTNELQFFVDSDYGALTHGIGEIFFRAVPLDRVIAPSTVSGPAGEFGTNIAHIRNQSGLSQTYFNGITHYDTYLATPPTHDNGPEANVYLHSAGLLNQPYRLGFDGQTTVNSVAIVNKDGGFGVRDFRLVNGDTGATIMTGTLNNPAGPQNASQFQRIDLPGPVRTSELLFIPESGQGAGFVGLSEVIFSKRTDRLIVSPFVIDAPAASFGTNAANVINHSGLFSAPIQLVDDYDDYVDFALAGISTHDNGPIGNVYLTSSSNLGRPWDLFLPDIATIESVAIYNKDDLFGVRDFEIRDGVTGEQVFAGTLDMQPAASQAQSRMQSFDFARPITTHYLQFVPLSHHGALTFGIGEIFFGQSSAITGDVNRNGVADADDIDYLLANLGSTDASLDFDRDMGAAGQGDVETLVTRHFLSQFGDANLDGSVNITDLAIVATFFDSANTGWAQGNFNGATGTNITDLAILATWFGFPFSAAPLPVGDNVPEPVTAALLLGAAAGLARRRRRCA